jgi:putative ABC transport system ATP-binding protein
MSDTETKAPESDSATPGTLPQGDKPPIVSARDIVMEFKTGEDTQRVLNGIDFDVAPGDLTFLVGPSGCGKTTLLSIISGTLTPTYGKVNVLGEDIGKMSLKARTILRRRKIGFVFQQYNLIQTLTAAENAAVTLVADGMSPAKAERQVLPLFERLGILPLVGRLPKQLSGGQQQRVAIARALIHEPSLLICDEPTAALDAAAGRATMELLREAALDAARAVIVVTHDSRVYRYADRIVRMEDGAIVGEGAPPPDTLDEHS